MSTLAWTTLNWKVWAIARRHWSQSYATLLGLGVAFQFGRLGGPKPSRIYYVRPVNDGLETTSHQPVSILHDFYCRICTSGNCMWLVIASLKYYFLPGIWGFFWQISKFFRIVLCIHSCTALRSASHEAAAQSPGHQVASTRTSCITGKGLWGNT